MPCQTDIRGTFRSWASSIPSHFCSSDQLRKWPPDPAWLLALRYLFCRLVRFPCVILQQQCQRSRAGFLSNRLKSVLKFPVQDVKVDWRILIPGVVVATFSQDPILGQHWESMWSKRWFLLATLDCFFKTIFVKLLRYTASLGTTWPSIFPMVPMVPHGSPCALWDLSWLANCTKLRATSPADLAGPRPASSGPGSNQGDIHMGMGQNQ